MDWGGAISTKERAGHFLFPSRITIDSARYIEMLKDMFEIHMALHHRDIFMKVGAPCHRSKIVSPFQKKSGKRRKKKKKKSTMFFCVIQLFSIFFKHFTPNKAGSH